MLTGLFGVALGGVMIAAGLFAAMVVHTLLDLRVLVIPSDLTTQPIDLAPREPDSMDGI